MITLTLKNNIKINIDKCMSSYGDEVLDIDQFYLILTEEESSKSLSYYYDIFNKDNLSNIKFVFDDDRGEVNILNCELLELKRLVSDREYNIHIFISNNPELLK